jgi:hypothetical protein
MVEPLTDPAGESEVAVPELDSVIESKKASLAHLIIAYHGANTALGKTFARSREGYRTRYPKVRSAYEASRGKIRTLYVCDCLRSGAAITETGYLEVVHSFTDASKLSRILGQCGARADEAYRLLRGKARDRCSDEYFSIACHVLEYYDVQAGAKKTSYCKASQKEVEDLIASLLRRADERFRSATARMAKTEYLKGMLVSVLALGVAATLALNYIKPSEAVNFFSYVLLAGAIGAMVSVLSRMTFGTLRLDYDAGQPLLRSFGAFRIVIGAILGTAVSVLLRGELLPISLRAIGSNQMYSYAGVAFLAGFGERWAQDVLSTAGDRLKAGKGLPPESHAEKQ